MADIEVRTIAEQEVAAYMHCIGTAFFMRGPLDDEEAISFWRERMDDLTRRHAAFDSGVLAGTAGAFGTPLSVPGGSSIDIAAVTGVTVLPTHRRRGILTAMMDAQLRDAIDRGETAAMLIAAEWPIYGRFGYGMAIEAAATVLDARVARFRQTVEPAGTIALVSIAELRELAPPVFDRHRTSTAGPIARDDLAWDMVLGLRTRPGESPPTGARAVVHRSPSGEVDGYAYYRASDDSWVDNRPSISIAVNELIATSDDAYAALWRFLAHIDWVSKVTAHVRPVDEPLRLLLEDGRTAVQRDRSDHMWVRLLDVPAALEARSYEAAVDVVIEVVDDALGRGGRWRLTAGPDGVSVVRSKKATDVTLAIDALSGAYMGGVPLWWFGDRVEEHTAGAAARLDTALRTRRAPWCTTNF